MNIYYLPFILSVINLYDMILLYLDVAILQT